MPGFRLKNRLLMGAALFPIAYVTATAQGRPAWPDSLAGLPLLFQEDFESGWRRWEIFDQPSFRLATGGGNTFLQVPQRSGYEPPVRGPYNRALIRELEVRDFILEARVRVTEIGRGHRGGLFLFGYRDPSNFCYAHYAYATSDRSHVFAKVDDAPRFTFFQSRSPGVPWTMGWQTLRLVRKFHSGVLEAYVDDMTRPVLVADDLTYRGSLFLYDEAVAYSGRNVPVTGTERFEWGRVGIGSFQGILDYDDVRVYGEKRPAPTRVRKARRERGRVTGPAARDPGAAPAWPAGDGWASPDGRLFPRPGR